jgi:phospholipase A1
VIKIDPPIGRRRIFTPINLKMRKKIVPSLLVIVMLAPFALNAQYIPKQLADSMFNAQSYFSIYNDNYFITGIPLDRPPSKYTSDVKYQISIRQLLTKNLLPFKSYLFLSYTQLSFWDIYRNSKPFAEINFNPSIGLAKRIFNGDRFVGVGSLILEHQSNGRDSIYSRSWNRVTVSFQGPVTPRTILTVKAWLPFGYKEDNPELLHYLGYGEASMTYIFKPKKLLLDCTIRKGSQWDWKGSIQTQLNYRAFKNGNEYFTLQWFQGYSEDLINYAEKVSMLRIGFIIKPNYMNLY